MHTCAFLQNVHIPAGDLSIIYICKYVHMCVHETSVCTCTLVRVIVELMKVSCKTHLMK